MKHKKIITYIFIMLITVPVVHFAFLYGAFFPTFEKYLSNKHRMLDITIFNEKSVKLGIAKKYLSLRTKNDSRPVILFLGTSFQHGSCFDESVIFTQKIQQQYPQYLVINASVRAGNMADVADMIKLVRDMNINVAQLWIDANLANTVPSKNKNDMRPSQKNHPITPVDMEIYFRDKSPLWSLWDLFFTECTQTSEEEFRPGNLPATRFDFPTRPVMENHYHDALILAQDVTDNIVFIIDPQSSQGFAHYGYDTDRYIRESEKYMEICREYANTICLNPLFSLPDENFRDITHLNKRGHAAFYDYIQPYLISGK